MRCWVRSRLPTAARPLTLALLLSLPLASGKLSDEDAAQRKLLRELVERSTRVYGVLYAALPEELRKQAESIPRGCAYGLWHWLQTKYQSTEPNHAAVLLEE